MVKGPGYSSGGRGGRKMALVSTEKLEAEQARYKDRFKTQKDILNNTQISDPYMAESFKKDASGALNRTLGILGANQKELNKRRAQGQEPILEAKKSNATVKSGPNKTSEASKAPLATEKKKKPPQAKIPQRSGNRESVEGMAFNRLTALAKKEIGAPYIDDKYPGTRLNKRATELRGEVRRAKAAIKKDPQNSSKKYVLQKLEKEQRTIESVKAIREMKSRALYRNRVEAHILDRVSNGAISKAELTETMRTFGIKATDLGATSVNALHGGEFFKAKGLTNPVLNKLVNGGVVKRSAGRIKPDRSKPENVEHNAHIHAKTMLRQMQATTSYSRGQRLNYDQYYNLDAKIKNESSKIFSEYRAGKITIDQARQKEIKTVIPLKEKKLGLSLAAQEFENRQTFKEYMAWKANPDKPINSKITSYRNQEYYTKLDQAIKGDKINYTIKNTLSVDRKATYNRVDPIMFPDAKINLPKDVKAYKGTKMTSDEKALYDKAYNGTLKYDRGPNYTAVESKTGLVRNAQRESRYRNVKGFVDIRRKETVARLGDLSAELAKEKAAIKKYSGMDPKKVVTGSAGSWMGPKELNHIYMIDTPQGMRGSEIHFKTKALAVKFTEQRLAKAKSKFAAKTKEVQQLRKRLNDPKYYEKEILKSEFYTVEGVSGGNLNWG